jgi:hypothetical protein
LFVDPSIIHSRAFPAHTANQADHPHSLTLCLARKE